MKLSECIDELEEARTEWAKANKEILEAEKYERTEDARLLRQSRDKVLSYLMEQLTQMYRDAEFSYHINLAKDILQIADREQQEALRTAKCDMEILRGYMDYFGIKY